MQGNNPDTASLEVPRELFLDWKQLILDRLAGNVHVNIKDGRILGWRVEIVRSNK